MERIVKPTVERITASETDDYILDELPGINTPIIIPDTMSTILIEELKTSYNYTVPEERLQGIKILDIKKMLRKFHVVNWGEPCTYEEGNGAYVYGGWIGIIIVDDNETLHTISIVSCDVLDKNCSTEIVQYEKKYLTHYRETFDPDIREKNEYRWIGSNIEREFKLIRTLVDSNDVLISFERRHAYLSMYSRTAFSDIDSDSEENPIEK